MIVASTIVPDCSSSRFSASSSLTASKIFAGQPVLLEQVAEAQDRRLVGHHVVASSTRANRRIDSLS